MDRSCWSTGDTDNIVVVDPVKRKLTWIPRDLWCASLGGRVNTAFRAAGWEGFREALRQLGFEAEHGLVLLRSVTEEFLATCSVWVPVHERIVLRYPTGRPPCDIEDGSREVRFDPPTVLLKGPRVHEWLGARYGENPKHATDRFRMERQALFVRELMRQGADFASFVQSDDVFVSDGKALEEVSQARPNWEFSVYWDVVDRVIDGKMVLVKRPWWRRLLRAAV